MSSLRRRAPLLATAVLAVSLVVAVLVAYELLLLTGRNDLDDTLRRERNRFEQSIGQLTIDLARGREERVVDELNLRRAVRNYLRLNPSNNSYLTLVRFGEEFLSSAGGPSEVVQLRDKRTLPLNEPGRLLTLNTREGDVRSLSATVSIGDQEVATFQVVGSLHRVARDARAALARLVIAALISLVIGAVLLTIALRKALVPLFDLRQSTESITSEDLSQRVAEPGSPEEVRTLALEINGMLDRIEDAVQARKRFLAVVSHELRTPLTIAQGHIETLAAAARRNPEAATQTAVVVGDELGRMKRMVDDLMALSHAEAEDFVVLDDVDVRSLFDDLDLRVEGLDLSAVTSVTTPPSLMIRADGERLAQALLNLIVNAHVHNPAGTTIVVSAHRARERVALQVADNGRGIDPPIASTVFEPFVHGNSNAPRSSGLGLAVVRAVVDAHGASIELETGEMGTTFTILIPLSGETTAGLLPATVQG